MISSLIQQVQLEWGIPGGALVVVRREKIEHAEAFGVIENGCDQRVTRASQFAIASITKTFTATAMAQLVEANALSWSDPVCMYLPEFALKNEISSRRLTIHNVLTHTMGLPAHDWLWKPADRSPDEILIALRHLDPTCGIGQKFQYSNIGYLIAGRIIERVSGFAWEEFLRRRLLDELGIVASVGSQQFNAVADRALPHTVVNGVPVPTNYWPITVTPAAGLNMSINGMGKWIQYILCNSGTSRSFGNRHVRELPTPRVFVSESEFAELGTIEYGYGFECYRYRGARVFGHAGGWVGWGSLLTIVPEHGIGIAVLINRDPCLAPELLTYTLLDRLLGMEPLPWFRRFKERRKKYFENVRAASNVIYSNDDPWRTHSGSSSEIIGRYTNHAYGEMMILQRNDQVVWSFRGLLCPLVRRESGGFELLGNNVERDDCVQGLLPSYLVIHFLSDSTGAVVAARIVFDTTNDPVFFEKA